MQGQQGQGDITMVTDAENESFLKHPDRIGGPTDPFHSFRECVEMLFPGKFQDYSQHELYSALKMFSWEETP